MFKGALFMNYKKIANSAVYEITPALEGCYLMCRRNRFDLIEGKNAKNPIFSSNKISHASNVFFNSKTNQALLVNTSGKAALYDLSTKDELCNLSLGHEMFGMGVASDSKNFYYINKKRKIMKLSPDGEKSSLVFEDEIDVSDIIFSGGRCFVFQRKENKENFKLTSYEVKCYERERLIASNVVSGIHSVDRRILDYDQKTIVILILEPTNRKGLMFQSSIGIFNESKMEYNPIFTIPYEWGPPYGYATCLQENLLALADGHNVYIVDLKSGEVIDKMSGEYLCAVTFMNPKELLVGSWNGLYWAELE